MIDSTEYPGVQIHETAVIDGDVNIGKGSSIGPFVHLRGPLTIGRGCEIGTGTVVGEPGEHHHLPSAGYIVIGNRVIIREHVVIQRGLIAGEPNGVRFWGTRIESGAFLMHGAHIAHDCQVMENATLSPLVVLGGHSWIGPGANIGIGAILHQFSTVGACAMIGMGSVVVRDVPVGITVGGNPAKMLGENSIGLDRYRLTPEDYAEQFARFWKLSIRPPVCPKD